jgi:hypothetical protein
MINHRESNIKGARSVGPLLSGLLARAYAFYAIDRDDKESLYSMLLSCKGMQACCEFRSILGDEQKLVSGL